jgi:hypothetical protein
MSDGAGWTRSHPARYELCRPVTGSYQCTPPLARAPSPLVFWRGAFVVGSRASDREALRARRSHPGLGSSSFPIQPETR